MLTVDTMQYLGGHKIIHIREAHVSDVCKEFYFSGSRIYIRLELNFIPSFGASILIEVSFTGSVKGTFLVKKSHDSFT